MKALDYYNSNSESFIEKLFSLLRIPSISAEAAHKDDMVKCAERIGELLKEAGIDTVSIEPTAGSPIVYAEKIIDPSAKTILIYGHYDVMPVEPLNLWTTPPFEPEIRDGKIWARGADDDKGQLFIHIAAIESLINCGELKVNVKFMLEGEEEIGSSALYDWSQENKDRLAADTILVSDTSMIASDIPSITCGLRGITYMEVEVKGPSHDLHSGLYGGAVVNPLLALTKIIAQLTDETGRIAIPGFYDKVRELTADEKEGFAKVPFSSEAYAASVGVKELDGEQGYSPMERTGVRPALDINGIFGGYTGEGVKTIIPTKAMAKLSFRLVPNQEYKEIPQLFESYIKSIAPKGVEVEVRCLNGGAPYVCPTTFEAYQAAESAIIESFGKKPLPFYSGGSIPIISHFEQVLGVKSVLLGFGLGSDAIHSPNEHFPLSSFHKGVETVILFHKHYCNL